MGHLADPNAHQQAELQRPGPHYPDRCIDCPEILAEFYGGVRPLRCMQCLAADRLMARGALPAQ